VKLRPSSSVTVALLELDARTAVIVPSAGGVAPNQPFFVRRRTNPFSPTSHATSALTSAPARNGTIRRMFGRPDRAAIGRMLDHLVPHTPESTASCAAAAQDHTNIDWSRYRILHGRDGG
jgi:hypothetical protein